MILFYVIVFMLLWVGLTGDWSPTSCVFGAAFGFVLLRVADWKAPLQLRSLARTPQALRLGLFFLWELILSNLRVAAVVLDPSKLRPGIVAVPLDLQDEWAITTLANLITLTPGSFTMGLSPDRRTIYVHQIIVTSPEDVIANVKGGFERRVREVFE